MKDQNAVFTAVQNDMVILELWLRYYTRYFEKVFVWGFNFKSANWSKIRELQVNYNFDFEILEEYKGDKIDGTPSVFLEAIMDKQVELLKDYRWVLFVNIDEILIPQKGNLRQLMKKSNDYFIPCETYEVIQTKKEKPINYSRSYFKQRKYWIKNPNYNKIILSRIALKWNAGLHQIEGIIEEESKAFKNTGLYLVHLKHADLEREYDRGPYPKDIYLDPNIMQHWRHRKKLIPEYIKKLL